MMISIQLDPVLTQKIRVTLELKFSEVNLPWVIKNAYKAYLDFDFKS